LTNRNTLSVCQLGDIVAALVKSTDGDENWILAEVVQYLASSGRYEVDDIDEEQKERHTLSKRRVIPLPLMRANPETDPDALFPKGATGKNKTKQSQILADPTLAYY
jgi:SAGA-associated factor 29